MTTAATARIRWDDQVPLKNDVYNIASTGYVGTMEAVAFVIYTPDEMHADWLVSARLVPGSQFRYAGDLEAAKAAAGDCLEEFVASLGAIFPAAFREAVESERDAQRKQSGDSEDCCPHAWRPETSCGAANALDWALVAMDRMEEGQ